MKGKRKLTAVDQNSASAKKLNVNCDLSLKWEVEDSKKWEIYPANVMSKINGAYETKKKSVNVVLEDKTEVTINFDKMVQKTKKTGWEKKIRCCVSNDPKKQWFSWSWKEIGKNSLNFYSPDITICLESSYLKELDDDISIKFSNKVFKVNMKTMTQKDGKTKRDFASVKRLVCDNPELTKCTSDSSNTSSPSLANFDKVAVDPACLIKTGKSYTVYVENDEIWDAMLNQTNLQYNNNKFFKLQVLKEENGNNVYVWFHWGRVGKSGQNNLVCCGKNVSLAKETFMKKFRDKTLNQWNDRHDFVKVEGKYDLVKIDYSKEKPKEVKVEPKTYPESKLNMKLQELIDMIFNVKKMEEAVKEMNYDSDKAPLGNLTDEQIHAGYSALKQIEQLISEKRSNNQALIDACNAFYTRIPHCFGMKRPPLIRTEHELKLKMQLLETLGDIQAAMKILDQDDSEVDNPLDQHYTSLRCSLNPVAPSSHDYKVISDYLRYSHGSSHNRYEIEVLDLFECQRHTENEHFNNVGNAKLLWHGSRLTNWAGILSQGLRIAPPEAPVTGYMFGKGIYFADVSSKSANYCYPTKKNDVGLLILCEVALGEQVELISAKYDADKLPKGKHSVIGRGQIAPDYTKTVCLSNGSVIPVGTTKDTGVNNPDGYTLQYNEYIVYNTNQVKLRYLLKIKFNFK